MAPFARMAIVMAVRRGLARAVIRDWDAAYGRRATSAADACPAPWHGPGRPCSRTGRLVRLSERICAGVCKSEV